MLYVIVVVVVVWLSWTGAQARIVRGAVRCRSPSADDDDGVVKKREGKRFSSHKQF